jgi:hypothetical protein
MLVVLITLGLVGWAVAASLAVLVYVYWARIGYWRMQAEHFRTALRKCDEQLQRQAELDSFEWVHDPTVRDTKRPTG